MSASRRPRKTVDEVLDDPAFRERLRRWVTFVLGDKGSGSVMVRLHLHEHEVSGTSFAGEDGKTRTEE